MSRTHGPPALVLKLASASGHDPGLALMRRVERALSQVEGGLTALHTSRALFTHEGGRWATRLLQTQDVLLYAHARLVEATGDGPIPAPRRPETIAEMHERVREWLSDAERSLRAMPPDVVPPEPSATVRPISPR